MRHFANHGAALDLISVAPMCAHTVRLAVPKYEFPVKSFQRRPATL
jgi:hypothetical protein